MGVELLAALKSLSRLNLYDCPYVTAGMHALRTASPNLTVVGGALPPFGGGDPDVRMST